MYNIHMIKGKVNMDNYNEKLLELDESRLYNNSKIVDERKNVKKD